ncbi:hypothetical protein BCR37DRAFT_377111 [Protomyces lactucae-debilis]|uniref:SET domain-containing protein n=1 Tax=Protomyces lactucae-debilis TaxID=2754530 RepID=A0A1Y2FN87_PROLT|nr:uncharacterized protein BCR37DRAFT_377111 [Protomyces lactucae-debilis]ORY85443.1 hypothetical protein BCR37DRAFT_377111 [Protomyces lactucae-debilis]
MKATLPPTRSLQGYASASFTNTAHELTEQDFHAGERIVTLEGTTPAKKAYTSVQRGREEHFELNSDFVFMNHSCDPNCILNVENAEAMFFEARRDIVKGEALGFFYPSTEYDMGQPFACGCKAKNCVGQISGAKALSLEELRKHGYINKHIVEMKDAEKA